MSDIQPILTDALTRFNNNTEHPAYADDVQWYAWPQGWGDTSCGAGGYAGQMMTTAQTVVVEVLGTWFVYVAGGFRYSVACPSERFFELMQSWSLPGRERRELSRHPDDEAERQ